MFNLLSNTDFWSKFGLAMLILASLGLVFTVLILLVNKFCATYEDPKITEISEKLSGANCGGCGFAGCADFAKALVEGRAEISNCSSTPSNAKKEIASILGIEAKDSVPMIAVVKCMGDTDNATKKFDYVGNSSCEAKNSLFSGDKKCSNGCLGGGTCTNNCLYGAIKTENGVAKTIKALCVGCSVCVKNCPKKVIELIPKSAYVYVACSSHCKGKEVTSACKLGCIGCGLCVKNCPENAITLEDNLAVIDYNKCTGCKTCVAKCPRKIIKENV